MQGGMVEAGPGSGFLNPVPDQYYVEIVDPEGDHRRRLSLLADPLVQGELGLPVDLHDLPGIEEGPGLESDGPIPLESGLEIVHPDEHGVYLECHRP